jgi:hypothetical protein
MCPNDGLTMTNHEGFKKLVEDDFAGIFQCSYVMTPPAVHSKVYIWTKGGKPLSSFAGSANYTQNASHSRFNGATHDFNLISANLTLYM